MKIKINPDLIIKPFEDGKIITEVATSENFYLEDRVFDIFAPCQSEFVDMTQIPLPENVTYEEFAEFVEELIELRVLLVE